MHNYFSRYLSVRTFHSQVVYDSEVTTTVIYGETYDI